jgi:diguanylate cyclase (GGDEF)-like protein
VTSAALRRFPVRISAALRRIPAWLPAGQSLDADDWARRHKAIAGLVWAHVLVVPIYGVMQGQPPAHALAESSIIAVFAIASGQRQLSQNMRSVMATIGLVTASAILTHFSRGLIEMHFHFFVVVAVISLYQSWLPFLIALGFVIVHHGVGGQIAADSVFNHSSAVREAWKWALIHGGFILAESAACLVAWRLNEVALNNERKARSAMAAAHSDLAAAQALASVGSWEWDTEMDAVWFSAQMYALLGHDPDEFTPSVETYLAHVVTEDRDRVSALIAGAVRGGVALDYECTITRADGERRALHARGGLSADGTGRMLGTCQDITERKLLEAEIEHRAFHDSLTGLANRALFLDRLEHALAVHKRTGNALALLYVDLDDFKTVNDNLGHGAGDALLIEVAKRLRSALRESDTVSRLGGDEFAIVLENSDPRAAETIADHVLEILAEPFSVGDARLLARASIGIAHASASNDAGDLLRHADIAMYAAKRQGKNGHRAFNEGMHSSLTARMHLEGDLADAIEHEQFLLHYQPLIDLATGSVDGVEALVRWDHPERGVLPPSEFITVAEEMGLISALGEWVLRQAISDVPALCAAFGPDTYVSVNVAAPQLRTDLIATVVDALSVTGVDASHLLLEITETCVMSSEAPVVAKLAQLREMGVRIAIDDFGTGYSSLSYLRELPVDYLKIDRAFVRDVANGAEDSALAHSIIRLGTVFGLRIVGEGIETAEQAAALGELGCHTGQGYHYHRPTDLESLIGAFATSRRPGAALSPAGT